MNSILKNFIYSNETIPKIPNCIEAKLSKELKRIKDIFDKKTQNEREIDIMIQNAFICVFVELIYDFATYLTVIDDNPIFNTNTFLESKPSEDTDFYRDFTETQLFQQFIQNFSRYNENIYFNEAVNNYDPIKKLDSYETNELKSIFDFYDRVDKNYIIWPYFLPKVNNIESNSESICRQLNKKYPKTLSQLNTYGIMKETHRIIGSIKEVNPEDRILKYSFYKIPGKEVNTKESIKDKPNNIVLRANIFEKRQMSSKIPNRTCKYVNGKRPDWEYTEHEKDEIREAIKDILSKIFKCEEVDQKNDKKTLLNNINNKIGRDYFISSIYQNKTSGGKAKTINESSFSLLSDVIFYALLDFLKLEENEKNYESVVLLIKSTMLYCKFIKKEQIDICDILFGKLKNYSLLFKEAFWEKWFNVEISEHYDIKGKKTEIDDKDIMETIEEIMRILFKFKISKEYVFKTIMNISTSKIKDFSLLSSFKENAQNKIVKANY